MKILAIAMICIFLAGCSGMALKEGGLYVNKDTCVGMDDFGVANVSNKF